MSPPKYISHETDKSIDITVTTDFYADIRKVSFETKQRLRISSMSLYGYVPLKG